MKPELAEKLKKVKELLFEKYGKNWKSGGMCMPSDGEVEFLFIKKGFSHKFISIGADSLKIKEYTY